MLKRPKIAVASDSKSACFPKGVAIVFVELGKD
jgi:hypothetical protein